MNRLIRGRGTGRDRVSAPCGTFGRGADRDVHGRDLEVGVRLVVIHTNGGCRADKRERHHLKAGFCWLRALWAQAVLVASAATTTEWR